MGFSRLDFSNDAYIQRILSKFFDTFFLKSIDRSVTPISEKLRMKCFLDVFSKLSTEGTIHHFKHFLLVKYLGNFLTHLAEPLESHIDSTFLFKLLDEMANFYCEIESGSHHMNHIFCDLLSLSVPLVLSLHVSLVSDAIHMQYRIFQLSPQSMFFPESISTFSITYIIYPIDNEILGRNSIIDVALPFRSKRWKILVLFSSLPRCVTSNNHRNCLELVS